MSEMLNIKSQMEVPADLDGMDETYARMALRIFIGPRDMEWHNEANQLLDHAPDYAWPRDEEGNHVGTADVYEVAGRIIAYCAGLIDWKPEEDEEEEAP